MNGFSKSYIGYIGVASKVQVSAGRIQALESELVVGVEVSAGWIELIESHVCIIMGWLEG